ncbi:thymocyte nuclear protein 1 [Nadsonia fulvescens var. elongata DSM 6958]|uniref:Thymocyte nuclear protein 1 n=1 Tax=Nadsonia fulvescens var. elongata DSM 6958 TaxID=857566 RepID=A0A1E3PG69_9ASCO|nr:thymocyte nuclear protein 1 [Nadsonia fulvescens var. elongata DSM 6958]
MTKTLPHSVDPQTGKRYWLIKSEPLSRIEGKDQEVAYPLSNLLTNSFTTWDGVRNHEAKNHMLNMSLGDYCLFYHSNCPHPGIVGIVEVCKEAHPDHSQWELGNKYVDPKSSHDSPRWWCVDVKFNRRLKSKLTLDILRADPELAEMALVKRGRLSVTPVRTEEFLRVLQMEKESALKDDLDCEIPRDLIDIVS